MGNQERFKLIEEIQGMIKRNRDIIPDDILIEIKIKLQKVKEEHERNTGGIIELKLYQIYAEGYQCTGQSSSAFFVGESYGRNFKEACVNYAKTDKKFAEYFDIERMTLWSCRLFDNLHDAQKRFG